MSRRTVLPRHVLRAWFADGASNLSAVLHQRGLDSALPPGDDWYLCPLCLKVAFTVDVFDEPDPPLTAEDAPPVWFGGSKVALTCKGCNSRAGTLFDSHAQQAEFFRQFMSGTSTRPMTVRYTMDGVTNTAEMYISGNGILLVGVPAANNPADIEHMTRILGGYSAAGAPGERTFKLSGQIRSNPDRARASWIRAAYVVAFAAFGWRYILQPAFNPLREYLLDPTQSTLPILSMTDYDVERAHREILIATGSEMQGVFVAFGGHQVILPGLSDQRTLDELSAAFVGDRDITRPIRLDLTGMRVPWPRRPMHMFDPLPVQIPETG